MKVKQFNKLVRDKIPQIIEKSNRKVFSKILSDEEFIKELITKRNEESLELDDAIRKGKISNIVEEMADVLLVEETIAKISRIHSNPKTCSLISKLRKKYHISLNKLKTVYNIKNKEKGRFDKRIFLIQTEEND
jgi:predicted house-cleaning noncanonical NTP pyrophosphatase (MazG superfamily)